MRIIITDDEPVARAQLQRVALRLNCRVHMTGGGEAAWALLQESTEPALILLDWMMPDLSGIELCRRIRKAWRGQQPYIILVSGRSATDDIVEGLDAGANDYLAKPFRSAELFARINVGSRVLALQTELSQRIRELESARQQVRELVQILPVCMYCRKVSPSEEAWSELEQYLEDLAHVELSHVVCPQCKARHHGDLESE